MYLLQSLTMIKINCIVGLSVITLLHTTKLYNPQSLCLGPFQHCSSDYPYMIAYPSAGWKQETLKSVAWILFKLFSFLLVRPWPFISSRGIFRSGSVDGTQDSRVHWWHKIQALQKLGIAVCCTGKLPWCSFSIGWWCKFLFLYKYNTRGIIIIMMPLEIISW